MKQYVYTFPVAVFLLLCAACTQADTVLPEPGGGKAEEGVPLSVKSLGMAVEVESRSIATGGPGEAGSNPNPLTAVGVCVIKTNSSSTMSFYSSNRTQQFIYNNEAIPVAWELADGAERLVLYTEKGTVYGYAPADKSVSLMGNPKTLLMNSVRVLDKQTFSFSDADEPVTSATDVQWDTDQDDYLYGTAAAQVDRWHPEVSLEMNHALAKVCFRVVEKKGGTAFDGCLVKKVVLKSSSGLQKSTSAKMDLQTGELSGTLIAVSELSFTAASGDLRPIGIGVSDASGASAVLIQAFGLVIPGSAAAVTLELTLDDGRIFTMSPAAASGSPGTFSVNWEKGQNYIYNIGLSPQGIEIANVTVAGWGEGGTTDVPME